MGIPAQYQPFNVTFSFPLPSETPDLSTPGISLSEGGSSLPLISELSQEGAQLVEKVQSHVMPLFEQIKENAPRFYKTFKIRISQIPFSYVGKIGMVIVLGMSILFLYQYWSRKTTQSSLEQKKLSIDSIQKVVQPAPGFLSTVVSDQKKPPFKFWGREPYLTRDLNKIGYQQQISSPGRSVEKGGDPASKRDDSGQFFDSIQKVVQPTPGFLSTVVSDQKKPPSKFWGREPRVTRDLNKIGYQQQISSPGRSVKKRVEKFWGREPYLTRDLNEVRSQLKISSPGRCMVKGVDLIASYTIAPLPSSMKEPQTSSRGELSLGPSSMEKSGSGGISSIGVGPASKGDDSGRSLEEKKFPIDTPEVVQPNVFKPGDPLPGFMERNPGEWPPVPERIAPLSSSMQEPQTSSRGEPSLGPSSVVKAGSDVAPTGVKPASKIAHSDNLSGRSVSRGWILLEYPGLAKEKGLIYKHLGDVIRNNRRFHGFRHGDGQWFVPISYVGKVIEEAKRVGKR